MGVQLRNNKFRHGNGPGTHWVCYVDPFYFDPFGLPPPENILSIKRNNTSQYQKKKISILCGYFCLFFIKMFQDGNSVYDILYKILDPINPSKNKTILKDFFYKLWEYLVMKLR